MTENEIQHRLDRARVLANEIWTGVYLVRLDRVEEDYAAFEVKLHSQDGPRHWVAVSSTNSWEIRS